MDHQLLIESVSEPVLILDVDAGHFIACNPGALDFFHLSREEIFKKSPFDLSPPTVYGHEAEAYARRVIQEALSGANPVFDWVHLDKEGTKIPCEIRLVRFPPYSKQIVRATILDKRGFNSSEVNLRESEERLRLTLNAADLGTFDWYPKEDRFFWDENMFRIFELDSHTTSDLNTYFFSVIHPEDQERVKEEFEEALKNNGPSSGNIEYRIVVNGKIKHILAYSKLIRNEDGEVIRMLGTSQDISRLRQSQENLRISEQLLKSVVEDQQEMIVRWKPGGIRTFVNKAYCETFELDGNEVIGKSFFPLLEKSFRAEFEKEIKALTVENPVRNYTRHILLPDGSKKWQEWSDRAYFDEDGNVVEYQSVGRDVTDVVNARKALAESESQYRNVFNQQIHFSALLDLDGKVQFINDLPLEVQGLPREVFVGKYFWNSPGWENNEAWQQKVKAQIDQLKQQKKPLIVEDEYHTPDNEIRYANSVYSLIKDIEGNEVNILVQAIDTTNEKIARKKIEERERQLSMIYENTHDYIILVEVREDGYFFEEINKSSLRLFKQFGVTLSKEELIGLSMETFFADILHLSRERYAKRLGRYDKIRETRQSITFHQEFESKSGTIISEESIVPIIQNDAVSHLLIVARDITEAYQSQQSLKRALTEVEELKNQLQQENIYLKQEINQIVDFENMVFRSSEFRNVLNQVEQVAKTGATVLITGETGTGKELIARAVHNTSQRSDEPMIKVNTAAIPKDLIESELFGYEKGAFTGASGAKPGKFELAHGGSIFLDEIGDMSIDLQVKILRVLQEGEVERLGSTASKKIDIRIIAATNKNLEEAVKDGVFREDLYFRLNVFPIEIPPLRSRPDDIPILVEHFIAKYSTKHNKKITSISKKVMDYLRSYSWPGNVRELENTIERALILSPGEQLTLKEVTDSTESQEQWQHNNSLEVIQENHIRRVLTECHWKIEGKDGAAASLRIKPSTLRDKMKKFKIERPD